MASLNGLPLLIEPLDKFCECTPDGHLMNMAVSVPLHGRRLLHLLAILRGRIGRRNFLCVPIPTSASRDFNGHGMLCPELRLVLAKLPTPNRIRVPIELIAEQVERLPRRRRPIRNFPSPLPCEAPVRKDVHSAESLKLRVALEATNVANGDNDPRGEHLPAALHGLEDVCPHIELDEELPKPYSKDIYEKKVSAVFEHVFESYQGEGMSVLQSN